MENCVDVKIETKEERMPMKQNPLSTGGKSFCRAVGYLTGDMKDFGTWLKGKPSSSWLMTADSKKKKEHQRSNN